MIEFSMFLNLNYLLGWIGSLGCLDCHFYACFALSFYSVDRGSAECSSLLGS